MKKRKYHLILAALAILAILMFLFTYAGAFWMDRWFDNLMHFLGGAGIGLISVWVWFDSGIFGMKIPSKREAFAAALIFAMIAGIWWEFFEYVHGIANPIGNYPLDTFNDLVADLVGGIFAGLVAGKNNFYNG